MFTDSPRINIRYDDWNIISVARRLDETNQLYAIAYYIIKTDFGYLVKSISLKKEYDSYLKILEKFAMSCENFVRFL